MVNVVFVGTTDASAATAIHDTSLQSFAPIILRYFLGGLIFEILVLFFNIIIVFSDDFFSFGLWRCLLSLRGAHI